MNAGYEKMQLIAMANELGVFDNSVIRSMASNVLRLEGIVMTPISVGQISSEQTETAPQPAQKISRGAVFNKPEPQPSTMKTDSLSAKVHQANAVSDTEDGGITSPWLQPTKEEIEAHGLPQDNTDKAVGVITPKTKPSHIHKQPPKSKVEIIK